MQELLGQKGDNLWITAPFYADYGNNIYFGNNCEVNMNCTFLDDNAIRIGDNALIAPNVQIYTAFQAEETFEKIMEEMENRIRGENPSLMEVRNDLSLPSQADGGVRLRWYSSDPAVLEASGKLGTERDKEQHVVLSVELSAGDYKHSYEIPVRVLPPVQTKEEQRITAFLKELRQRDDQQKEEPWLSLPDSFQGKALSYRAEADSGYESIILLGVLLAVLLAACANQGDDVKNLIPEREREERVVNLFSPMEKTDPNAENVARTASDLTIAMAEERLGVTVAYMTYTAENY